MVWSAYSNKKKKDAGYRQPAGQTPAWLSQPASARGTQQAATATPRPSVTCRLQRFASPLAQLGYVIHNMPDAHLSSLHLFDSRPAAERYPGQFGALQAETEHASYHQTAASELLCRDPNPLHAAAVQQQLSQLPRFKGRCYRSFIFTQPELTALTLGRRVRFRSFVSATKDMGCLAGLRPQTNAMALFHLNGENLAADISQVSSQPGEQEVLIGAGESFQVSKVQMQNGLVLITFVPIREDTLFKSDPAHGEAGPCHFLMLGEEVFTNPTMQSIRDNVLKIGEDQILPPAIFELNPLTGAAFVQNAEDNASWKIVAVGAAAEDILEKLSEMETVLGVSVLVAYDPLQADETRVQELQCNPLVYKVVPESDLEQHVFPFLQAPMLPRFACIIAPSPGTSDRSSLTS